MLHPAAILIIATAKPPDRIISLIADLPVAVEALNESLRSISNLSALISQSPIG
jgi:hypothetical protein